jgi:hypothetical protein
VSHLTTAIVATKTVTLILGSLITYFSWKAFRRTRAPALRALAIGFGVVTFGAVVAGVVDLLTPLDLLVGVLVNSVLTMVGFVFITYSLYVE